MSTLSKSLSKYSDTSENSEEDEQKEEVNENDTQYSVWQYFTKLNDKEAKCNLCERVYSYSTTSANLKSHLATKHIENFPDWKNLHDRRQYLLQPFRARNPKRPRTNHSYLWNYFSKIGDSRAECSFCEKAFSYKTTSHNLKMHLIRAHPRAVHIDKEKQETNDSFQYSDGKSCHNL